MAFSLKTGASVYGSNNILLGCYGAKGSQSHCQFVDSRPREFMGKQLDSSFKSCNARNPASFSVKAQASLCVSKAMRWWEKTLKPNMIEIHSANELLDSLLNAGDRLVILDFYSPGCGGCKALHPKICQLAESNPDAVFLKVNYEELKTMCYSLNVHVLPFFRFYRGSEGKLCSFSCTNATIKKFKDALAKYGGSESCSLGPARGLAESEIMALVSAGELPTTTTSPLELDYNDGKKMTMGDLVLDGSTLVRDDNRAVAMA